MTYDGFISYSHAADDLLAPRLQAGLQKFAKPWWKRRAVRIFRDESSLSANPRLWSSITEALDSSGWFVLLLSPDAARSEWVNQEIAYWVANKEPGRILPVVTGGTFSWGADDVAGDAVPDSLRAVFTEEPRWVDLRFARNEEHLDLQNPTFSAAVADIASAIRGVPKDELESEEVREHRRTVRTAWAAGLITAALAVAAFGFALNARTERGRANQEAARSSELAEQEAVARRDAVANADLAESTAEEARRNAEEASRSASLAEARELAASAINVLDEDPQLSILLTLEAIERTPSNEEQPAEVITALWEAGLTNRLIRSLEHGFGGFTSVALSPDETRLAVVTSEGRQVQVYSAPELELLWVYGEETSDSFTEAEFSPDGSQISVAIVDSESSLTARLAASPDELPNRVVILDTATGSMVSTLAFPFCRAVETMGWSPDGTHLAVAPGPPGGIPTCVRPEAPGGAWAEVFDTVTWGSIRVVEVPLLNTEFDAVAVQYDQDGRLYLFADEGPRVYSAGDYELVRTYEFRGGRAVAPEGDLIADFSGGGGFPGLYDTATGSQVDRLAQFDSFPTLPRGISFSSDGTYVFAATDGAYTLVWDAQSGEQSFRLPGGPAFNSVFDRSRAILYTAHFDGSVKVWNLGPGGYGLTPLGDVGVGTWVNANRFTLGPELGAFVAIDLESFSFYVRFFDVASGELIDRQLDGNWPYALPDGRFVHQKFPDSTEWVIYDAKTGEEVVLMGCAFDPETEICLDTDEPAIFTNAHVPIEGNEVIIEDDRGNWTVFDLAGNVVGSEIHDVDGRFRAALAVSASWVLVDTGTTYAAIDRQTSEVLWLSDFVQAAEGATFGGETSSGGSLAAVIEDGAVRIIDLEEWTDRVLPFTFGRIRGIGFSSDDRYLALGDEDRVSIVDLSIDQIVQTVPVGGVSDFYWLDDTTLLIGAQGLWASLSLDTDDLVESVRGGLTRTFTPQECVTYRIDPCPTLEEVKSR